ncbi:MAG: TolC family protein [Bacteroidia bacterium]|nr:TolC family protein [Bacteroidia bacterium]
MNKSLKILFSLIFILFQQYSEAQINDSLSSYLKIAVENNTGLKAEFLKYSASLEKVNQSGSLPDPQLDFAYYINSMEQISGKQIADIKLMQMFPWFGALKAAKDEASQMAYSSFQNFLSFRNELFFNIKTNYYSLYQTKKEIEITEKNIKILKTIEQLVLIKYQTNSGSSSISTGVAMNAGSGSQSSGNSSMGSMGNSTQQGVNNSSGSSTSSMPSTGSSMSSGGQNQMVNLFRIQMEINSLENNLALLNDRLNTDKISFNRYLNRLPNSEVFINDSLNEQKLPLNIISMTDSISNNPMVKMYLSDSAAYNTRMKMIKRMSYPMVGIGVNYSIIKKIENSTNMMNGQDMIMPMLTVTLPIYRKKYNSMQREAQYLRDAATYSSANVKNDIYVSFQQALQNLNDAERRILLYSKQTTLANKSLELIITSFSVNGSDFEEILRMEQQLLDFEFKKIEAITNKNTIIAQLLFLTGN